MRRWSAPASRGLSWELGFDLWTTTLIAASLLLCHHILSCRPGPRDRLARSLLLSLIAAGLVILPLRDNVFGDRDHLFAVLFTPYLLLLSPYGEAAAAGRRSRLLIGACAAIGLGIKPYFLAIWGMQQLYWMLARAQPLRGAATARDAGGRRRASARMRWRSGCSRPSTCARSRRWPGRPTPPSARPSRIGRRRS